MSPFSCIKYRPQFSLMNSKNCDMTKTYNGRSKDTCIITWILQVSRIRWTRYFVRLSFFAFLSLKFYSSYFCPCSILVYLGCVCVCLCVYAKTWLQLFIGYFSEKRTIWTWWRKLWITWRLGIFSVETGWWNSVLSFLRQKWGHTMYREKDGMQYSEANMTKMPRRANWPPIKLGY